jgi:hypothetical protein
LAEVLEGVPDKLKKPIQQFCSELRQGQQALQERLAHVQGEFQAEKQDQLRLAREAAECRQKAVALRQVLDNTKSKALGLGSTVSAQAGIIAELRRCPELAIPKSVNLRRIDYDMLAWIANQPDKEVARIIDLDLARIRKTIIKIATFHKLPRFKAWGEKLTREQMLHCHALGFSESAFLESICARSPDDITNAPLKLLSDESEKLPPNGVGK